MLRHPADSARYHARKAAGVCVACGTGHPERGVRCVACARRRVRRDAVRPPGGRDCPSTLDEIGRALGITRERVRQVQAAALNRFCERMMKLGWSHDDALLGLAILGVQSSEQSAGGRQVIKGQHYTPGRAA